MTSDGRNTRNIKEVTSKGYGLINEIMNILNNISLGPHYFQTAVLLRNSILVNSLISNAESLYSITKKEMEEICSVDRLLLLKILNLLTTTMKEYAFLELGILLINMILKERRLNYFHHIITRERKGMLFSFITVQWFRPTVGDWTETIKEDLKELNLPMKLEELMNIKRETFKATTKRKIREMSLAKLIDMKNQHSKMIYLDYKELKMQPYLIDKSTSIKQKKTLIRFRSHMENFHMNYKNSQQDLRCKLCFSHPDSQILSVSCPAIKKPEYTTDTYMKIFQEDIPMTTIHMIMDVKRKREIV